MKKFQNVLPSPTAFLRCWSFFFLARLLSLLIFGWLLTPEISVSRSATEGTSLAKQLLLCVVAPIVEEILFRVLAFKILAPMPEKLRIFASAILFATAHNTQNALPAFALGILLGAEYSVNRKLINCILLHATTNLVDGVFLSRFPVLTVSLLSGGAVAACGQLIFLAARGRSKRDASP